MRRILLPDMSLQFRKCINERSNNKKGNTEKIDSMNWSAIIYGQQCKTYIIKENAKGTLIVSSNGIFLFSKKNR